MSTPITIRHERALTIHYSIAIVYIKVRQRTIIVSSKESFSIDIHGSIIVVKRKRVTVKRLDKEHERRQALCNSKFRSLAIIRQTIVERETLGNR